MTPVGYRQPGRWGKPGRKSRQIYIWPSPLQALVSMAGISEAKNIAAINTDQTPLSFKHCAFGIVEDYRKVVPAASREARLLYRDDVRRRLPR